MTAKETWSQKLAKARKLRASANASLYDRMQLLIEVYEDSAFRADCEVNNENPEDRLDWEVNDTCADFLTLVAVVERFPERETWETMPLDKLVATVLNEVAEVRKDKTPKRMSWKQKALELQKKVDQLQRQLEITEAKLRTLEEVLKTKAA